MSKKLTFLGIAILISLAAASNAGALDIKLGSLAPTNSLWDTTLHKLKSEWLKISNNKVVLKIYSGGSVGGEADMLRKLQTGELQASAMTAFGLGIMVPQVNTLQIPRLVKNEDEQKYLLEKLHPVIDNLFNEKGYKLLVWAHTGWTYLFSREPVFHPADLMPQKLWVGENSKDTFKALKAMGCNPTPLKETSIVIKFQTGGLDAIVMNPYYMLTYELYKVTSYMNRLKWVPFIGAVIVRSDVWERIPVGYREEMTNSAKQVISELEKDWMAQEERAIVEMQKYGLVVNEVTNTREWDDFIRKGYLEVLETREDKALFLQAEKYLSDYRKEHGTD